MSIATSPSYALDELRVALGANTPRQSRSRAQQPRPPLQEQPWLARVAWRVPWPWGSPWVSQPPWVSRQPGAGQSSRGRRRAYLLGLLDERALRVVVVEVLQTTVSRVGRRTAYKVFLLAVAHRVLTTGYREGAETERRAESSARRISLNTRFAPQRAAHRRPPFDALQQQTPADWTPHTGSAQERFHRFLALCPRSSPQRPGRPRMLPGRC